VITAAYCRHIWRYVAAAALRALAALSLRELSHF
jgi:hypothetical protein